MERDYNNEFGFKLAKSYHQFNAFVYLPLSFSALLCSVPSGVIDGAFLRVGAAVCVASIAFSVVSLFSVVGIKGVLVVATVI